MRPSRRLSLTLALLALAALPFIAVSPATSNTSSLDGSWSAHDPNASAPSLRREYAAVYDERNHRYLIFAGANIYAPDESSLLNEVWVLSLGSSPTWSQLSIAGSQPGQRHSPQWGYDAARNRLLIFGGYGRHYPNGELEYLNDVWQLSLDGTPAWTEIMPSGTPPTGRLAGAAVYDPLRQRFVGFGGTIGVPTDTWVLDLSGAPEWSSVPTTGASPPGGYAMTVIYDPTRDRMLTFGGSTSDYYYGVRNDVWALNLHGATPSWHKLSPQGTRPVARRSGTAFYDPLRKRMVIYGGWDSSENGTASFLGDAWALSLAGDPEWTQLTPEGGPPAGRDAMTAAYDPEGDRMVVFGGWSGAWFLNDTWFLGWNGSALAASVAPQAQAAPGVAQLQWQVQNATGPYAAVYRRQNGGPWSSVATVELDASGSVSYQDATVSNGGQYGYLLVVSSQEGAIFGGEAWVDVPSALGVDPPTALAFALHRVQPNPARERFAASFALPSAAAARLEFLDLAGRQVWSREVGHLGAGNHHLEIGNARDHAPGMYFLRLAQSGRSQVVRVVLGGR